jgi:hypothetical protein
MGDHRAQPYVAHFVMQQSRHAFLCQAPGSLRGFIFTELNKASSLQDHATDIAWNCSGHWLMRCVCGLVPLGVVAGPKFRWNVCMGLLSVQAQRVSETWVGENGYVADVKIFGVRTC